MSLLKEYRCTECAKLLCKGVLIGSTVEIKCKGCGALVRFVGESPDVLMCYIKDCPRRVTLEMHTEAEHQQK